MDTGPDFSEGKKYAQEARAYYNRVADRYHQLFRNELDAKPYDRALLDRFALSLPRNALVCDAGCGPSGHIAAYLANRGLRVVGIDCAEECIRIASSENPAIDFRLMDLNSLDFDNDSFDGIVAYYSVIYTPKYVVASIFSEIYRVLRPGGNLLVAVKGGTTEGYIDDPLGSHTRVYLAYYSPQELRRVCEASGLSVTFADMRQASVEEIQNPRLYTIATKLS